MSLTAPRRLEAGCLAAYELLQHLAPFLDEADAAAHVVFMSRERPTATERTLPMTRAEHASLADMFEVEAPGNVVRHARRVVGDVPRDGCEPRRQEVAEAHLPRRRARNREPDRDHSRDSEDADRALPRSLCRCLRPSVQRLRQRDAAGSQAPGRARAPTSATTSGSFDPAKNPDLAIEVVITSGGLRKLAAYHRLGVREVWFWIREALQIYELRAAVVLAAPAKWPVSRPRPDRSGGTDPVAVSQSTTRPRPSRPIAPGSSASGTSRYQPAESGAGSGMWASRRRAVISRAWRGTRVAMHRRDAPCPAVLLLAGCGVDYVAPTGDDVPSTWARAPARPPASADRGDWSLPPDSENYVCVRKTDHRGYLRQDDHPDRAARHASLRADGRRSGRSRRHHELR